MRKRIDSLPQMFLSMRMLSITSERDFKGVNSGVFFPNEESHGWQHFLEATIYPEPILCPHIIATITHYS